jgi:hypothetical protein
MTAEHDGGHGGDGESDKTTPPMSIEHARGNPDHDGHLI